MVNRPIALQLFSVRDDMNADFVGTLKKVKAMGYDGVEFAGLYGKTVEEVKAALEESGLVAMSAHVALQELLANPANTIAKYKAIGCKWIVIPHLPPELRAGTGNFDVLAGFITAIGAEVKKQGMTLLYHNHDFEFEMEGDVYFLDALYSAIAPTYLQTELDTCWVNVGGEVPAEYIAKYAGRSPVVHLKDFFGTKSDNMYQLIGVDETAQKKVERPADFAFRPVGHGVQDVPAIIAAGEKAGAQWFVVEQDMPSLDKTPMECAQMSIEYLRSL